jgi:hypothetical protein
MDGVRLVAEPREVSFCSPFDERLAHEGPPAVFLLDPEGQLRFDAEWTRDLWGRAADRPGPGPAGLSHEVCWVLARDRDSGWVQIVLVTSPDLLAAHPRLDVRRVPSFAEASAARASLGPVPLASAW